MSSARFPLWLHILLVAGFLTLATAIWLLPVLTIGMPFEMPSLLVARNFAESGEFVRTDAIGRILGPALLSSQGQPLAIDGRLSGMIFAFLSQWVPWDALLGWIAISAVIAALSLLGFWLAVWRLLGPKIAWMATVILSFLPLWWLNAVTLDNYGPAILFLFWAFASFALLHPRFPFLASLLTGILLGLSAASKDVFLVFLPWFILSYLWFYRQTIVVAVVRAALLLLCLSAMYVLPYAGDIELYGYPVNRNVARLWPGAENIENSSYLHLYPDPYTYFFDRSRFDAEASARYAEAPMLEKLRMEKSLLSYDVIDVGVLGSVRNGIWLFLTNLPSFFQVETVGGIWLWLFLVPGFIVLWRRSRLLLMLLLGLFLSSEFIIRFALHYERSHLLNVLFVLSLLAAAGIGWMGRIAAQQGRRWSAGAISAVILCIVTVQLLQTVRLDFARRARRSIVASEVEAGRILRALPAEAVVATDLHPNAIQDLVLLGERTTVLFKADTIERLLAQGKLSEVFARYGVTHALLYSDDLAVRMRAAVPGLLLVDAPPLQPGKIQAGGGLSFLLNVLR